jgi:hypothetical protein
VDRVDASTVEVVVYKSGRQLFTKDELDADLSVPLYAAAARALYPWAKNVRVVFWMLRYGARVHLARTKAEVTLALRYAERLLERLEEGKDLPANVGGHCARCSLRGQCAAYGAALAGTSNDVGAPLPDVESVARERERVTGLLRIYDGRKRELEAILRSELKDAEELRAAGTRYRVIPTRSPASYPLRATVDAVATAAALERDAVLERIGAVDGSALEKLLDDLSERLPEPALKALRDDVEARAQRTVIPRFTATPDRKAR